MSADLHVGLTANLSVLRLVTLLQHLLSCINRYRRDYIPGNSTSALVELHEERDQKRREIDRQNYRELLFM